MPPIPSTVLGTSDPANICKGFALWPGIGTSRAGISLGGSTVQLINLPQTQVLTFRLLFQSSSNLFLGVCGPGYGIRLDASGSSSGSALQLTIANDVVTAGLLYGINFGAALNFQSEVLVPKWVEDGWNSRFVDTWQPLVGGSVSFNVDVIDLIVHLIAGRVAQRNSDRATYGASKSDQSMQGIIGVFNIFGTTPPGSMAAGSGTVTVAPTLELPVNLVSALKAIPKVGAFILLIENLVQLSLGIRLVIGFPIDVQIARLSLDASQFDNLQWSGPSVTGFTNGSAPANPQSVGMSFRHSISTRLNEDFQLSIGLFMTITFIKVFNVGVTTEPIAVPNLLGQTPTRQSFVNPVSNKIGQPLGFDPLRDLLDDEEIEVVFEPLGSPS